MPNGDILAFIDNYGTSSLRWTAGSPPQTKVVRFNGANQLIWSHAINRIFDAKNFRLGMVVRVDAVKEGYSVYRVGTEVADGSVGGRIVEADSSFC